MKQSTQAELTYKVLCNFGEPFYTDDKGEAERKFQELQAEYGDGIRMYEAEKNKGKDDEEIEWEIIDCFDADDYEETNEPPTQPVKESAGDEWSLKGLAIGLNSSEESVQIINHAGNHVATVEIYPTEANAKRIVEAVNGWDQQITNYDKLWKEYESLKAINEEMKEALQHWCDLTDRLPYISEGVELLVVKTKSILSKITK